MYFKLQRSKIFNLWIEIKSSVKFFFQSVVYKSQHVDELVSHSTNLASPNSCFLLEFLQIIHLDMVVCLLGLIGTHLLSWYDC